MRFLVLILLAGCFERAADAPQAGCNSCHGGDEGPAPPGALGGGTSTDLLAVGAHASHLDGTRLGQPVACEECHVVPGTTDAEGHVDTPWPAEVKWGPVSKTGGLMPVWDREAGTCADTYCHGGATPVWTDVDGSEAACGACHGTPPPDPHPNDAGCQNCHAPVAGPALTLADPSKHADGEVDLEQTGGTCGGACHGDDDSEAPPRDTTGGTDPTTLGVGAHRAHLAGGAFSRPVECVECHVAVNAVGDPGHIDGTAAVVFGALGSQGTTPAWDRGTATCSDTYCHQVDAVWTDTDAPCGGCHMNPPPPPHPAAAACEACHGSTAGPNLTIVDPSKHVDGTTDF